MTTQARRPYASRLAIRFAIILALALFPAGFIAFVQTNALEREIKARSEVALMGATLQAATPEIGIIRRTRGLVASLAVSVVFVLDDPKACNELMQNVGKSEERLAVVAFIPISGIMSCSSVGKTLDFSESDIVKRTLAGQAPNFVVNSEGPISKTSILGVSHPVFDATGTYLGYVGASLPQEALGNLRIETFVQRSGIDLPIIFWTFDRDGTLLTANVDAADVDGVLPQGQSLRDFIGKEDLVFQAVSRSGVQRSYAVIPIVDGEFYLMSAFVPPKQGLVELIGVSPYLPPLFNWLIGLFVAGLAAEYLVTRHVRKLNQLIRSFARGDRRLQALDLVNAPFELGELGNAYLAMTESITRSEAELEDSVHQKEVLLREVHHRVKNNLQLISSIMNIQIRSAQSVEAKELLKNLQDRIMSLATVHRGLYQTSGLADVRARELIPDIVRQIMAMSSGPEKPFQTETEIDDLRLVPDQAVPLSLLLTEALTNAIKHAGATRMYPGKLSVRLRRSGGSAAVLEVVNSRRERDPAPIRTPPPDAAIGSQLITAFVQQLGGRQEFGEAEGEYYLRVTFDVSPLSMAESRRAPEDSDHAGGNASAA